MLEVAIAFFLALVSAPGLLLALAVAPWLRGWLVLVLTALDLALLLEIFAVVAEPGYAFGQAFGPRLLASGAHLGFALLALRLWRRLHFDDGALAARP